jgi:hypothetical protein
MASVNHFLSKHLVNYRSFAEFWTWLITAVILAVVSMAVLFFVGAGLRLEPGRKSKLWGRIGRAFGAAMLIGMMLASLFMASPASAFQEESPLTITIDEDAQHVKTGDSVEFGTTITNSAGEASPPLIVAMNVINLDATGDVVDPEDWSPQRTQYIDALGPGETASQKWIINTILEGDFMVYMVLIPEPESAETTSHPVTSGGIHLTVDPFTRLNPGGVLPFAIGGPILLLAITYFVYRRRRQQIDMGGPS